MVGIHKGAIPANLRRNNERAVIGLLMRLGLASRAELAKAAGLSQPTAGKIINNLLEWGMVQELEETVVAADIPIRLGRPGRRLRLNGDTPRFIGIEIGVEETRVTPLPIAFPAGEQWKYKFSTGHSPEKWKQQLKSLAASLPGSGLWGVTVSAPGIVDENASQIVFSPNLHWTEKADLPGLIQSSWNLPLILVQEIRALALGHMAANPDLQDFFLVDFGNGVGGAIVEGGRLYSNPLPLNGELGHTPVVGNRRACGCGSIGCMETLVSQPGLLAGFQETRPREPATWEALQRKVAQSGLPSWLASALDATATIIAGALNVLGLRRLVVTGCLNELPPCVLEHLFNRIQLGSLWARFGEITCEAAPRRRAAGLAGIGLDRLVVPVAHDAGLRGRSPEKK